MHTPEQYAQIIESAIAELPLGQMEPSTLYEPISYALSSGGKRIRPLLTLMACEAAGGDPILAVEPAIGFEMFHNFTLLHDDVMDNSDTRRGRPTVCAKYGENTAILSGDTMLTLANQLVMGVADDKLRAVLENFNSMALDVYDGQQFDMDFEERQDVTLQEYINMISLKTSALLGAAAKQGGLIAGADDETCDALYEYGLFLGLAFQIQDDYLDVYGDAATFGKPIGGDILNDKKTFLAISTSESEYKAQFDQAREISDPEQKIAEVTAVYTRAGMKELCADTIRQYSDMAHDALNRANLSDEGRKALASIVTNLVDRKK